MLGFSRPIRARRKKDQREGTPLMKRIVLTATLVGLFAFSKGAQGYITPHQFYDPIRHLLINAAGTHWDLSGADVTGPTAVTGSHLQFVARAPELSENSIQSTLTLRIDKGDWRSARTYAERWLKDFPKFGYELQMSRETQLGNLNGFDMEFKGKNSPRTARQFIVKRPGEMWIFTCTGDGEHFATIWSSCEKILKTASAH
jgi:hypothetical protein